MKSINPFGSAILLCSILITPTLALDYCESNEFIVKATNTKALRDFSEVHNLTIESLINYPEPSDEVLERFGCYYLITLPQGNLIDELASLQGVVYVKRNEVVKLEPEFEMDIYSTFNVHDAYIPSDPFFSEQWGLEVTQTDWVWPYITGEGISIAVIDGGIDADHEDLAHAVDFGHSYNFRDNNNDFEDSDNGHGTQVTGVICMEMDNERGGIGCAPDATIWSLKADDGAGTMDKASVIEAIVYSADKDARVINMSFGFPTLGETFDDAINYAWDKGLFLCASAGNDGGEVSEHYPSDHKYVMGVGATNQDDTRRSSSNYGEGVDIYAPGTMIVTAHNNGGYGQVSGTSVATPFVTSLAALVWQQYPEYSNQQVWDAILHHADSIALDVGPALRMNTRKAIYVSEEEPPILSVSHIQTGSIVLDYVAPVNTSYNLGIYDVSGRRVYSRASTFDLGSGQITCNPSDWNTGVYFWRIIADYGEGSGKLIYLK